MAKKWPEFGGEYEHNGKRWCLDISAPNWKDAEARVESIRKSYRVLGKLEGTIPVSDEEAAALTETFRDRNTE